MTARIDHRRAIRQAGGFEAGAAIKVLTENLPHRPPAISKLWRTEVRPFYMVADFFCATNVEMLAELEGRQGLVYSDDTGYGAVWSGMPKVSPFDAYVHVYMRHPDGVPITRRDLVNNHEVGHVAVLWEGAFAHVADAATAMKLCNQSCGLYLPMAEQVCYDDDPSRPDDNCSCGTFELGKPGELGEPGELGKPGELGDEEGMWMVTMHVRGAGEGYLALDVLAEAMTFERAPYHSVEEMLAAFA